MTENARDIRFDVPLYTVAEAARGLGVPPTTLARWGKGYEVRVAGRRPVKGAPIVTMRSGAPREPVVPFVGLAEAMVLAAIRSAGVPLQRVRPALELLKTEIGLEHALASKKLYTDGAEVLFDYARSTSDEGGGGTVSDLVVVRSGQRVFAQVIIDYLSRITYGRDGYAQVIRLPGFEHADVVADPRRSFGQPIFTHGGARVSDVLDRFWAGERLEDLADEFGVPAVEIEDVLRAASRRAA